MPVPLIESAGGASMGSGQAGEPSTFSTQTQQPSTSSGAPPSTGPSVTLEWSGDSVSLDEADLRFLILATQTLLLAYVAYKEVSAA